MTTIAWDGKTIASDSSGWYGDQRTNRVGPKFLQRDGYTIAVSGAAIIIDEVAEWWLKGRNLSNAPPKVDDGWNALIIEPSGEAWVVTSESKGYAHEIIAPFAMGTGERYAVAALDLGFDAVTAVEVAMRRDAFTAGKIHSAPARGKPAQMEAAE